MTGKDKHRISENYSTHKSEYHFTGLTFTTHLNEIKIFEKNNPNVSINVCNLVKCIQKLQKFVTHKVYSLKVVKEGKTDHFNIFIFTGNEKSHYT